jgi:hypothetical protein
MQIVFEKLSCKRFYGVEMEIGNEVGLSHIRRIIEENSLVPVKSATYRATINNAYWDVKHDGSCGKKTDKFGINEGGYEVNSYKAFTAKDLSHICHIAKKLKQSGLQVNRNCGLHVHVDASDFSPEQMGVFMFYWLQIEDIIFQSIPDIRKRCKYCSKNFFSRTNMFSSKQNILPIDVWEHYRPKTTKLHDNMDRRLAVNFINYFRFLKLKYFHRPTVEFRFPEGTLISYHLKNWVKLFIHFVNKMSNESKVLPKFKIANLQETLEILGLNGDDKSFALLSPSLYETKIWLLKRINRNCDYRHMGLKDESAQLLQGMGVK